MVAFQPNPDKLTPLEELGWGDAKETAAVDPPRMKRLQRSMGKKASGYTVPGDADKDPFRNPTRPKYTPEQWGEYKKSGMTGAKLVLEAHRSYRAEQEAAARAAEPARSATKEELEARHQAVADDWDTREADIDDDTTLTPPTNYRYFKRPDEMQK